MEERNINRTRSFVPNVADAIGSAAGRETALTQAGDAWTWTQTLGNVDALDAWSMRAFVLVDQFGEQVDFSKTDRIYTVEFGISAPDWSVVGGDDVGVFVGMADGPDLAGGSRGFLGGGLYDDTATSLEVFGVDINAGTPGSTFDAPAAPIIDRCDIGVELRGWTTPEAFSVTVAGMTSTGAPSTNDAVRHTGGPTFSSTAWFIVACGTAGAGGAGTAPIVFTPFAMVRRWDRPA